ncbi:hypothetical protein Sjap_012673 [Stephania japonica]|uniref:Uncharacterized protein n=1 Tax=Stephania japonica TaxID=461633 RepID=A0AAP0P0K7_9MAGN
MDPVVAARFAAHDRQFELLLDMMRAQTAAIASFAADRPQRLTEMTSAHHSDSADAGSSIGDSSSRDLPPVSLPDTLHYKNGLDQGQNLGDCRSCPDPSSPPSHPLFPAILTPFFRRRPLWWLLCRRRRHLCSAVFPSAPPLITTLPSSLRSTPPSSPLPGIVASAPQSLSLLRSDPPLPLLRHCHFYSAIVTSAPQHSAIVTSALQRSAIDGASAPARVVVHAPLQLGSPSLTSHLLRFFVTGNVEWMSKETITEVYDFQTGLLDTIVVFLRKNSFPSLTRGSKFQQFGTMDCSIVVAYDMEKRVWLLDLNVQNPSQYLKFPSVIACDLELVNSLSKVIKAAAVLELLQLDLSYYDTLEPHTHCLCDVKAEIQRMREEMSQSAEEARDDPHVDETDLYYKYERWTSWSELILSSTPTSTSTPISHQETLTPPMAVPTPTLDANDVYHPRMYEPEDEEQTNFAPLQQEWIDAFSDTHPLPRPDRDI